MVIKSDLFIKCISWFFKPAAITLWPFIIISPKRIKPAFIPRTLRHEGIHLQQQKELWLVGFYVLYLYYFLKYLISYKIGYLAYRSIPFEIEAHEKMWEPDYLKTRERFAWRKYL